VVVEDVVMASCATSFFRCFATSLYMIPSRANCGVKILDVTLFRLALRLPVRRFFSASSAPLMAVSAVCTTGSSTVNAMRACR
jgi:hypothetical protein